MKIGLVHNNINNIYGGIENQILSLTDEISSVHELYFFTISPDSNMAGEMRKRGIPIIELSGNLWTDYIKIKDYINLNGIEIIQFHTFDSGLKYRLIKLLQKKIKVVIRVHTYIECSWIPRWRKKLYYLLDSATSFCVDKYIINGKYLHKEFINNTCISEQKMRFVIDGTKAICPDTDVRICSGDLKSPEMLMIANVIPHKGHDIMIEALGLLKDKGKNVKCYVLGAVDRNIQYMHQLKKQISNYGLQDNVTFLGFDSEIKKFLRDYKIVILPSDSEGTPNCIMEAMSMKRLVIVSNTGGVSEMVEDGVSGFLHVPMNAEALCDTLLRVMNYSPEDLEGICLNGYYYWQKNLSAASMGIKFNDIYKELCE